MCATGVDVTACEMQNNKREGRARVSICLGVDAIMDESLSHSTGEIWYGNRSQTNRLQRMVSSGLLRRVALVRTDVTEESGASFIRVTKIGELGTRQAATAYVGC
jgi:hypothetical protein